MLAKYRGAYSLNPPLTAAADWLILKQNADGGFGTDNSTLSETAYAFMAILEVDPTYPGIEDALRYMEAGQNADGSFAGEVYLTAVGALSLDASFNDQDGDTVPDMADNCFRDFNDDQLDNEGDGLGDVCDADDDNDGIPDSGASSPSTTAFSPMDIEDATETMPMNSNPASFIGMGTLNGVWLGWYRLYDGVFVDDDAGGSSSPFYLYVDTNDCGCIVVADGDTLSLTHDEGQALTLYLPSMDTGPSNDPHPVTLYVADDGSTYWDQPLLNLAKAAPAGDNCPFIFNPDQTDTNGDGIGDLDSDGDRDGSDLAVLADDLSRMNADDFAQVFGGTCP